MGLTESRQFDVGNLLAVDSLKPLGPGAQEAEELREQGQRSHHRGRPKRPEPQECAQQERRRLQHLEPMRQ